MAPIQDAFIRTVTVWLNLRKLFRELAMIMVGVQPIKAETAINALSQGDSEIKNFEIEAMRRANSENLVWLSAKELTCTLTW